MTRIHESSENQIESQLESFSIGSFTAESLPDTHEIVDVKIEEELGRPYLISVKLFTLHEHSIEFIELMGKPARVTLQRPGEDQLRSWTGMVIEVHKDTEIYGRSAAGGETPEVLTSIQLVPAVSLGILNQATRIYQEKTALEIIETVLREILEPHGRTFDGSQLSRDTYLRRDYCTQYKESSFAFVHRLMEDEGIGYYFRLEDGAEAEELVLFDRQSSLPKIAYPEGAVLTYAPNAGDGRAGVIPVFDLRLRHGADSLALRDFDWAHTQPIKEARAAPEGGGSFEVYQHGFGDAAVVAEDSTLMLGLLAAAQSALMSTGLPAGALGVIQQVQGSVIGNFTEHDLARRLALRLELLVQDRIMGFGATSSLALAPGSSFELVGHPTLGVDGEYLITRVTHSSGRLGETEEGLVRGVQNVFECIPLRVAWRPKRKTPAPSVYGVQTATVSGPEGLEIHTDGFGRIQVRFHWDRAERGFAEATSCWIRCAQVWAGAGHPGFSFIPRVGMEVIVTFVDGNPDRPLVIGCVHNAANPTPTALPVQATKSVIRTRTVPYGTGYNELSFEDASGMERVHLRAQRDLDELVRRDHTSVVGRDERSVVKRDRQLKVGRNSEEAVGGERVCSVDGGETVRVGGHGHRSVQGTETTVIGGSELRLVHGGNYQLTLTRGAYVIEAQTELLHRQGHNVLAMVGSDGEAGGGGVGLYSPDEIRLEAGESHAGPDEGDAPSGQESNQAKIRVLPDKIELSVGDSKIEITSGCIRVNNKTFPA